MYEIFHNGNCILLCGISHCTVPRWRRRTSCEPRCQSCLTWAKPSAGIHKNCPQVLRLMCDLQRDTKKAASLTAWEEKQQDPNKWESQSELFIFWLCLKVLCRMQHLASKEPVSLSFFNQNLLSIHYILALFPPFCLPSPWCVPTFYRPQSSSQSLHSFHARPNLQDTTKWIWQRGITTRK